ncbi:MAG: MarR family transcriptional regulator [Desulfurococcaceae archaeon]
MGGDVKRKVLELLKSYQGKSIPQSFIHRILGVSKSTVSEVLSELEKEGLISRTIIGRVKIVNIYPFISETQLEYAVKKLTLGLVFSSEYMFLGGFIKRLRRKGVSIDILVYRDGLEATRALASGWIDLVLSPLVGQLYIYPLYRTYRVIATGLRGGFSVLGSIDDEEIYSSLISTMDYVRSYLIRKKMIKAEKTIYYNDPMKVITALKRKGIIVTWHPIYLKLERIGLKTIYTHKDIDIGFCCTLAASTSVGEKMLNNIIKAYTESIEDYKKNPGKNLVYYSSITGIDISTLKSAISEYSIAESLDKNLVNRVARELKVSVPSENIYTGAYE